MEIRELLEKLDDLYPLSLQEDWDNSGLQVGNINNDLKGVVISLDLEEGAIDLAKEKGCNLILNHHPYFFAGQKKLDFTDPFYYRLEEAVKNDITVFANHTNLDLAKGGVNDNLAKLLGLKDSQALDEDTGFGRVGFLKKEEEALVFLKKVKDLLSVQKIIVYGNLNKKIKKVGVCGGAGSDFLDNALQASCDLYLTGDIKYHQAMDYSNRGLLIGDLGHFSSENHIIYRLEEEVKKLVTCPVYTYSKEDDFRKFI